MSSIVDSAKKNLRLPVCIGTNKAVDSAIDKINDINFLTALGLAVWGNQLTKNKGKINLTLPGGAVMNKTLEKLRKWFLSLIP